MFLRCRENQNVFILPFAPFEENSTFGAPPKSSREKKLPSVHRRNPPEKKSTFGALTLIKKALITISMLIINLNFMEETIPTTRNPVMTKIKGKASSMLAFHLGVCCYSSLSLARPPSDVSL